jgi:hypothetical protein
MVEVDRDRCRVKGMMMRVGMGVGSSDHRHRRFQPLIFSSISILSVSVLILLIMRLIPFRSPPVYSSITDIRWIPNFHPFILRVGVSDPTFLIFAVMMLRDMTAIMLHIIRMMMSGMVSIMGTMLFTFLRMWMLMITRR